jgi:hypothetical protein
MYTRMHMHTHNLADSLGETAKAQAASRNYALTEGNAAMRRTATLHMEVGAWLVGNAVNAVAGKGVRAGRVGTWLSST